MRFFILIAALTFLSCVFTQETDIIPGEYLTLLKTGLSDEDLAQHVKYVQGNFSLTGDSRNELVQIHSFDNFKALFLRMTPQMVKQQSSNPNVEVVEPNRIYHTTQQSCNIQDNAIWNLARIDERAIDFVDAEYTYDVEGTNVDAYVVDTGILTTHAEFANGRAVWGTNTIDSVNTDCNGHGTHVAGTIGGRVYGVAKNVKLIAVKVLNCGGSGTTNGVIAGVNWVGTAARSTGKKSVANMSLGGGFSSTLNAAVDSVVDAGVTFVVAAGNDNRDGCNYSPASAAKAITLGATSLVSNSDGNQEDRRSSFSNFGTCVTLFAPGSSIKAAWIDVSGHPANQATNIISGTSMASPHSCGVAALVLSRDPTLTPAQVKASIVASSTNGVVDLGCPGTGTCSSSPNKFLYTAPCQ